MSKRVQRYGSLLILAFMIFLGLFSTGCMSFSTPLLSTHAKKSTVIITRAPIRIYATGTIDDMQVEHINSVIRELDKCKYYPYQFNDSYTANTNIELRQEMQTGHQSETKIRIKK